MENCIGNVRSTGYPEDTLHRWLRNGTNCMILIAFCGSVRSFWGILVGYWRGQGPEFPSDTTAPWNPPASISVHRYTARHPHAHLWVRSAGMWKTSTPAAPLSVAYVLSWRPGVHGARRGCRWAAGAV